ncbi:putative ATP-dependent RNA helicase DBP6 [Ascoidea rubescens DSM 1968]|uniref:ATP-dependent RNA helicase n=1 Tax=Ascoidea rubescens DSM 1968 TaxID=1344418 RepID=A0A1D2VCM6_9ASCO|nr:P-loop containing nucleoside triphosphate hydrolase protein [Ascoidea rubescens DSM 1968]ODV59312.1 P-loop containing nucleoside triphosphate hydrolase protein [Ascoidea rubescens DSM 1968]
MESFSNRFDPSSLPDQKPISSTGKRKRDVGKTFFENSGEISSDHLKENGDPVQGKHKAVLQRFKHAKFFLSSSKQEKEIVPLNVNSLEPLPQPLPRASQQLLQIKSNQNTLDWLPKQINYNKNKIKNFKEYTDDNLLDPRILNNLVENNFEKAFSVQTAVLDTLLLDIKKKKLLPDSGNDLLINSPTGSGKTISYLIPIIQYLSTRIIPKLSCIILVPTKPLITQVFDTLIKVSQGINLTITPLNKNSLFADEAVKLRKNVSDIIVSTPGRLVDHLQLKNISLKNLKYLIIDEADRLFNQSFQNWVTVLFNEIEQTNMKINLKTKIQFRVDKIICSSTLFGSLPSLTSIPLFKPKIIVIDNEFDTSSNHESTLTTAGNFSKAVFSLPSNLKEFQFFQNSSNSLFKPLILLKFLIINNFKSHTLIFTKSNDSSSRLARLLQLLAVNYSFDLNIQCINSTLSQFKKQKILDRFSAGEINILVSTDLMARGIDILTIKRVINYDLPMSSREYVHRVGRTSRAGNTGEAITFIFGNGERKWFNRMMKDIIRKPTSKIEIITMDQNTSTLVEADQSTPYDSIVDSNDRQLYKSALEHLQREVAGK